MLCYLTIKLPNMNKKTINIIYWISTGLILAMMLFSAVSSFIENPDGAKMLTALVSCHIYFDV